MISSLARLDGISSGGDGYQNYANHYLNMGRVPRPSSRYLLVESNWGRPVMPSPDRHFYQVHGPGGSTELRPGGAWLPGGICNVEFLDGHVGEISHAIKMEWQIYGVGIGWVK